MQLFIVIKRKAFFSYLKKYKIRRGHIWTSSGPHFTCPNLDQIGPPFYRPRSGLDRVGRFITSLAQDRLPYIGATFFPIGARSAPHQNFYTGLHGSCNTGIIFCTTKRPITKECCNISSNSIIIKLFCLKAILRFSNSRLLFLCGEPKLLWNWMLGTFLSCQKVEKFKSPIFSLHC